MAVAEGEELGSNILHLAHVRLGKRTASVESRHPLLLGHGANLPDLSGHGGSGRTPAPSSAPNPPDGPDWIHEIKHDGFRLMARREPVGIGLTLVL
jgi:hypothetical protein